jgi:hypothetical protein
MCPRDGGVIKNVQTQKSDFNSQKKRKTFIGPQINKDLHETT